MDAALQRPGPGNFFLCVEDDPSPRLFYTYHAVAESDSAFESVVLFSVVMPSEALLRPGD
jgi:hypothetical protein